VGPVVEGTMTPRWVPVIDTGAVLLLVAAIGNLRVKVRQQNVARKIREYPPLLGEFLPDFVCEGRDIPHKHGARQGSCGRVVEVA
jgi:hypothetical protein